MGKGRGHEEVGALGDVFNYLLGPRSAEIV